MNSAIFLLAWLSGASGSGPWGHRSPTPPARPVFDYVFDSCTEYPCADGQGTSGCRYFVPEGLGGGSSGPVVVMLHGGMFGDRSLYRGHIEHLCRQGNIVVFPKYLRDDPAGRFADLVLDADYGKYLERAVAGTELALLRLGDLADRRRIYLYAHSSAATLALAWPATDPAPRGLLLANPVLDPRGRMPGFVSWMLRISELDWQPAAADFRGPVFLLCGEEDQIAPCADSLQIQAALRQARVKPVFRLSGDDRGSPPLRADHFAALSSQERCPEALLRPFGRTVAVDVADYGFYWPALDALLQGDRRVAFALGRWSDGTPLRPVVELGAEGGAP